MENYLLCLYLINVRSSRVVELGVDTDGVWCWWSTTYMASQKQ
jgi:hypothetical protein